MIRIPALVGSHKPLNQYLLVGDDTWLWVDAGIADTPEKWIMPYLAEHSLRPAPRQLVVITHADVDHFGGVTGLRDHFPELLACAHPNDARLMGDRTALMRERYLAHEVDGIVVDSDRRRELDVRGGSEVLVDIRLGGGEIFDLGTGGRWEAMHVPGHSAGHLALWDERQRRIVLGDAIMGWGTVDSLGRLVPPQYCHADDYKGTIDRVEALRPRKLFSSHHAPLRDWDITTFLDESRAAVQAIEESLAQALQCRTPMSLSEICVAVGRATQRWPEVSWVALAEPLVAHLRVLQSHADVEVVIDRGERRYVMVGGGHA